MCNLAEMEARFDDTPRPFVFKIDAASKFRQIV